MKFLNDEYTLDIDALGDKKQVDKIRDLILESETPFSIGLSGRWGSGKTSVMKYLMASLGGKPIKHRLNFQTKAMEEEGKYQEIFLKHESSILKRKKFAKKNIHTIWFNPWENENHEEPMVGLLQAIHHHFSFYASTSEELKKIVSVTIQAGLDMLGSLKKLGRNAGTNIKDIGEKYEHDNFQYVDRNQKFKFIFEEAIEILLQGIETVNNDARIIIFIDDLDRCEDKTIAKLLKEIKQYLSTKRCVFVFGYDRHHIEKSLANIETKTSKETRDYLEKLFQATFYIKEADSNNLESFVKKIVEQYGFVNNPEIDEFVSFISSIIDPNPRRLKNYLTSLYFHVKSSANFANSPRITQEKLQKLALIAYLKLFYESVYSALENKPDLLQDLLAVFNSRNIVDTTNQREYFFHLEFKNHLHGLDIVEYGKKIKDSKEYEEKFLSEVYEMQGKHKSFENYMEKFVHVFDVRTELEKYL